MELTQTVFIQHIHLSLSFFSHSNDERANAAGWGESPAFSEHSDVFCRRFGTFSELFRKALAFSHLLPFRKCVIQY